MSYGKLPSSCHNRSTVIVVQQLLEHDMFFLSCAALRSGAGDDRGGSTLKNVHISSQEETDNSANIWTPSGLTVGLQVDSLPADERRS